MTGDPAPFDEIFPRLFAGWVTASPEAEAVVFGERSLTYLELDRRASRMANHLRMVGVAGGDSVGVLLDRSPEAIVTFLAVLKTGAVFAPVDPREPDSRLAFMVKETGAGVIVSQRSHAGRVEKLCQRVVLVDDHGTEISRSSEIEDRSGAGPDDLAYVIFTSGTSGRPKGVLVPHRGLGNCVRQQIRLLGVGPGSRVLQFSAPCYDASIFEMAMALGTGGTLCMGPQEELLPGESLIRLLRRLRVTIVTLTPTVLAALPIHPLHDLEVVTVAGEPCPPDLVARWAPGRRFFNLYGPTETTIWATAWECTDPSERPPIGHPIGNTRAYVMNDNLEPVADGVTGELCIGGVGVAHGYLNQPDLTASRFVADPGDEDPCARLYRTGDRARIREDGAIEFLGRADLQVKVRGVRIELEEVEGVLRGHPAVAEAAVALQPVGGSTDSAADGETSSTTLRKDLVAHLVPTPCSVVDATQLRRYVEERLPAAMVPAAFLSADSLPRLPSGKLNREALPQPSDSRRETDTPFAPPFTPAERRVAAIWSEVLGLRDIGRQDDFLAIGGNSLALTQVVARMAEEFGVEVPFASAFSRPTVAALGALVEELATKGGLRTLPAVVRSTEEGPLPLGFAQEQVWFLDRMAPGNLAYNAQATIRLHGPLEPEVLESALSEIVKRHVIYRTSFHEREGSPCQVVHPPWAVELDPVDLGALDPALREAEAEHQVAASFAEPFRVGELPLVRWRLIRLGPEDHLLVHVEHHFVHDGWSFSVLVRELSALYAAFASGRPSPLPEPLLQYGDFACWERDLVDSGRLDHQLRYWRERLAGSEFVMDLPADRPRPRVKSFRGAAHRFTLSARLWQAVQDLGTEERTTTFMTVMAAFSTLLHRTTGQNDIVVGTGVANRRRRDLEGLIGMMVNIVPLRVDFLGRPTFREILGRVREATLGAHAHQELPFPQLVESLAPRREAGRNPIFQVALSFHDSPVPQLVLGGARGVVDYRHNGSAKFDLNVVIVPPPPPEPTRADRPAVAGAQVIWEYDTDLFDEATIVRQADQFTALLERAVADPGLRVGRYPLLPDSERRQIVEEWAGTRTDYPRNASVHELFEGVVEASPDNIAIEFGEKSLSYRDLNDRANRLARHLRHLGVAHGDLVGLSVPRSVEMIVATLAILKAGGAYVPLDSSFPKERLAFMLRDTNPPVVVTLARLIPDLAGSGARMVCLDRDREAWAARSPKDLGVPTTARSVAYVMYTSGSTGEPKGVEVRHRGVVRLVRGTQYAELGPDETLLQLAPMAFDAATFEIWGALLNGGRLVVFPDQPVAPAAIGEVIRRHGVTTLWLTAPLFHQMVDENIEGLEGVRQLLAGGDVISPAHVKRVLEHLEGCVVVNGYGPTEGTTFTCCHRMEKPSEVRCPVPIGRPLANTRVYILDPHLEPVPIGVQGELHIAGDGLAQGYLNRGDLTAGAFVPDPFTDRIGSRLYRTGDLVRYLPDGNIEFLGRLDDQVKIRGFRVEPGEIETTLCRLPSIREAAVTVAPEGSGERRIVAFCVPSDGERLDQVTLRRRLREKLPEFMVPSVFVELAALPLTPSGKLDRRALPTPREVRSEEDISLPRTPLERLVAEVWQELLGVDRVSLSDNFFDIGGHSLAAIRAIAMLEERTGVRLSPADVMLQTLRQLAASCETRGGGKPGAERSTARSRLWEKLRGLYKGLRRRSGKGTAR